MCLSFSYGPVGPLLFSVEQLERYKKVDLSRSNLLFPSPFPFQSKKLPHSLTSSCIFSNSLKPNHQLPAAMKTFTLLTYSATALLSALNISSVVAVPQAESPAYRADLPHEAEYVYDFEQVRGDSGSKVIVLSYSWDNGDDKYNYDFSAAEFKSGPHARRAESPKTFYTRERVTYVLAPADQQPPPPAAAFILSPVTPDKSRVYYRPFLSKTLRDGTTAYILATDAELRAAPDNAFWRAYQVASETIVPEGVVAKLSPVPNSYAARDLARVRAQQKVILAGKKTSATNSTVPTSTSATFSTLTTSIRPAATL